MIVYIIPSIYLPSKECGINSSIHEVYEFSFISGIVLVLTLHKIKPVCENLLSITAVFRGRAFVTCFDHKDSIFIITIKL